MSAAFQNDILAEGRASFVQPLAPYLLERAQRSPVTVSLSERRRFLALCVGVYACIGASTSYLYNLFSGALQKKYEYQQSQMASIATFSTILGLVVFPLANAYDYYGPKPLFFISMTALPIGAILFAFAFADIMDGSVLRFTVFNALLSIGSSMFDIAALMTVMSLFPSSRGAVIAVMKTYVGLGSAIYGAVQMGLFDGDPSGFFYAVALFSTVVGLLAFFFIDLPPYHLTGWQEQNLSEPVKNTRRATKRLYLEQVPPKRRFAIGFLLVVVLVVFLPTQSVYMATHTVPHRNKLIVALVTLALVGCHVIIALPLRCLDGETDVSNEHEEAAIDPIFDDRITVTPENVSRVSAQVSARLAAAHMARRGSFVNDSLFRLPLVDDETDHIAPQYQTSFFHNLRTPELWALTYSMFCIMGVQGVVVTNARFVYAAFAEHPVSDDLATSLTVINGTGSAVGRILMSVAEMWTQQRPATERIPLTAVMFIPSLLVLSGCISLLLVPHEALLVPFILTALGNGCGAAAGVLVTRSIYAKDVANHYNFLSVGSIVASIVLNKGLYGMWYSKKAAEQARSDALCFGRDCMALPFAVLSALAASGVISNLFIHLRYRSFCQQTLESRRPHAYEEDV